MSSRNNPISRLVKQPIDKHPFKENMVLALFLVFSGPLDHGPKWFHFFHDERKLGPKLALDRRSKTGLRPFLVHFFNYNIFEIHNAQVWRATNPNILVHTTMVQTHGL
jgi:hypothetical protein